MSGKKLAIIIVSVLAVFALLGGLFVVGIVATVFYTIGNSAAATTAKEFLRRNERLERDIGEVRDFGWFITGNIETRNGVGQANLNLKVMGERRNVNASVRLVSQSSGAWRVVQATYQNDAGENIELPVNEHTRRVTPEQIFGSSAGDAEGLHRF